MEKPGTPQTAQHQTVLLADRGLVEVSGPGATDFLQGLLTNDVDQEPEGAAIFAGLLTSQAKILCDFFVIRRAADVYWLECGTAQAGGLLKRLSMYKLRAKIAVTDRSDELVTGVSWGTGASNADAPARPDLAAALLSYADPRFAPLGYRHIFALAAVPSSPAAHQQTAAAADAAAVYHAHRIALFVPQGGSDYLYGEAIPHEAGYDSLHGVDFEKGCYVGQEVVARMHHRGAAKTRISGVELARPLTPEDLAGAGDGAGSGTLDIRAADLPVGTLGSRNGTRGIAMIRLDRAEEALQQGVPLQAGGVALTLRQPPWAQYSVPGTDMAGLGATEEGHHA